MTVFQQNNIHLSPQIIGKNTNSLKVQFGIDIFDGNIHIRTGVKFIGTSHGAKDISSINSVFYGIFMKPLLSFRQQGLSLLFSLNIFFFEDFIEFWGRKSAHELILPLSLGKRF
ncbi:unknown protein [Microcystis aeruginosa NIES-843]|uniref:Uncharacterized protein n=1 Tax=Microcystis aeruginosa (strain NIES-843 / IAM M-2473) TaxID=449447 RepID=B0JU94_MICAN|nr:unknown protein [Microcystis aeruginosa NIES-843]